MIRNLILTASFSTLSLLGVACTGALGAVDAQPQLVVVAASDGRCHDAGDYADPDCAAERYAFAANPGGTSDDFDRGSGRIDFRGSGRDREPKGDRGDFPGQTCPGSKCPCNAQP